MKQHQLTAHKLLKVYFILSVLYLVPLCVMISTQTVLYALFGSADNISGIFIALTLTVVTIILLCGSYIFYNKKMFLYSIASGIPIVLSAIILIALYSIYMIQEGELSSYILKSLFAAGTLAVVLAVLKK